MTIKKEEKMWRLLWTNLPCFLRWLDRFHVLLQIQPPSFTLTGTPDDEPIHMASMVLLWPLVSSHTQAKGGNSRKLEDGRIIYPPSSFHANHRGLVSPPKVTSRVRQHSLYRSSLWVLVIIPSSWHFRFRDGNTSSKLLNLKYHTILCQFLKPCPYLAK